MVPTGQQYSTIAAQEQLTSNITNASTSIPVTGTTGFPITPFTVIFDIGQATQEAADCTLVSGNNLTVTRAVDGTSAQAHSNGGTVTHAAIGRDFREARAHMDAAGSGAGTTVHGIANGSVVVGTTDVQTLTNKTLTSPVINTMNTANPNITGTVTGNATYSGITATSPVITGTVTGAASYTGITATSPAITGTVTGGATYNDLVVANDAVGTIPLHVEALTATTANLQQWDVNGVQQAAIGKTGALIGQTMNLSGLTGAVATSRLVGATTGGPPTTGSFLQGDYVEDTEWGILWYCTSSGSPGVWASAGTAKLSTQTLGTNTATVTFSGLPSYFSHLVLIITAQSNGVGATGYAPVTVTWNSIASGYNVLLTPATVGGGAVTAQSATAQTAGQCGDVWNAHFGTAGSGRIVAWFPNYQETTFRKMLVADSYATDGGTTGRQAQFGSANSSSTAAITSLSITNSDASSFITGSVFQLLAV